MSSTSFPLLLLPELARWEILERMKDIDLLNLSTLSKRAKRTVKETQRTIAELRFEFHNDTNTHCIELHPVRREEELATLEFDSEYQKEKRVQVDNRAVPLNVLNADMWCLGEKSASNDEKLKTMDEITEHILSVFNVDRFELQLHHSLDLEDLFVWKHTKTFREVELSHGTQHQMDFVCRNLEIVDLKLFQMDEGVKYTGPLDMVFLHNYESKPLSLESVMNMKCKEYSDLVGCLTPAELNTLLKHWINGGLENLEYFSNQLPEDAGQDHLILEGIETVPWDSKKRPKNWNDGDCDEDFSEEMDIQRNDGRLVTVLMNSWFELYFWHPKHL